MSFGTILFGSPLPLFSLHPDTINLRDRIIAKGSTISSSQILSIDTFVKTIYKNNLRDLFVTFYPFAGDNFVSAKQALWFSIPESAELIEVGSPFSDVSYSISSGFSSNGSQALDSSIMLNDSPLWSYSVYKRVHGSSGAHVGTTHGDIFAQAFNSDSTYYSAFSFADTPSVGWYTAQRLNLFKNGQEEYDASHTTNPGANSSPTNTVYFFARNNSDSIQQPVICTFGCASIGYTKTLAQELIIYNAVQTLMTSFGRNV